MLLDGPFAGQVRSSADLARAGCRPEDLLADIARHGWRWEILWPEHPEQPQSWVGHWVAGVVATIRDEHGIDLAAVTNGDAPDADEVAMWARADLAARVIAAIQAGRAVRFMGHRWRVPVGDQEEQARIAGEIEDAIVGSGHYVTVLSGDRDGDLTIGVGKLENPPPR